MHLDTAVKTTTHFVLAHHDGTPRKEDWETREDDWEVSIFRQEVLRREPLPFRQDAVLRVQCPSRMVQVKVSPIILWCISSARLPTIQANAVTLNNPPQLPPICDRPRQERGPHRLLKDDTWNRMAEGQGQGKVGGEGHSYRIPQGERDRWA